MVSYAAHYAVWVLSALGVLGVGAFVLAGVRYGRLTGRGFGVFLGSEGVGVLIGERSAPAPDKVLSRALLVARVCLLAAAPLALVTGFLTAF